MYVCDKFRICQNGPLDKFMQFLFICSSIEMYGIICGTNLCDPSLTRIIPTSKSHTQICHFTVLPHFIIIIGYNVYQVCIRDTSVIDNT